MSAQQHPPGPLRPRPQHLHEIEFYELQSTSRRDFLKVRYDTDVRARLLDPRLQRIISAAANGWVVERFR